MGDRERGAVCALGAGLGGWGGIFENMTFRVQIAARPVALAPASKFMPDPRRQPGQQVGRPL